jgi:tripartite-type tricarboxylate transporter receptor subunit TctC
VKEGNLRPLAVTSLERSPHLPDVPTVGEAGAGGSEMATWFGLWAPKGTPDAVVQKIAADAKQALDSPEVKEKFVAAGFIPHPMTPSEFDAFITQEREKFRRIITTLGLQKQ